MTLKRTDQQQALCEAICDPTEPSIMTEAYAGSAKTTTAVMAINDAVAGGHYYPHDIQFVAFSKKIAQELERKMPDDVPCGTLNSTGHRAWGKQIGKRLSLDTKKVWKAFSQAGGKYGAFGDLSRLMAVARAHGLVPDRAPGGMQGPMPDNLQSWADLIDTYGISLMEGVYDPFNTTVEVARQTLSNMIHMSWDGTIDFEDQLYMPTIYGGGFTRYPLVGIDEYQDVSVIQRLMCRRMVAEGGRLIGIGDPNQAIYGFRGAHHDSMNEGAREWKAKWMPLHTSFRCPQSVVKEANRYVPNMQPWEHAPIGRVIWHDQPLEMEKMIESGPIAIVCRYNRPILAAAFGFISRGIGATILGRDIGQGLKKTISTQGKNCKTVKELRVAIKAWFNTEMNKAQADDSDAKMAMLQDRYGCLLVILDNHGESDSPAMVESTIERLFSEQVKQVTLSTIHRAKGLEWPRVYFLNPSSIPSKYAKKDWEKKQEFNAAYVAITRAQEELHYLEDDLLR